MEMTTASVAVYDKTNNDRWIFLGVVGIDVTTCNIEKQLFEANPTIQDTPPWPEETKFTDCRCAESYTYAGQEYSGCTTADWPVPWCATEGCGIKIAGSSISTGYWADCKPFGVRAELEKLLLQSGEECETAPIDSCEIEALRPEEYRCNDPEMPVTCNPDALAKNNWHTLPGMGDESESSSSSNIKLEDWALNSQSGSSYNDAIWSSDASSCDQCRNEEMRPACALPVVCDASGIPNLHLIAAQGSAVSGASMMRARGIYTWSFLPMLVLGFWLSSM